MLLDSLEQLHSLYRLHNIVRVIKSRKLRWAGHVARMDLREIGMPTRNWVDLAEDRDY